MLEWRSSRAAYPYQLLELNCFVVFFLCFLSSKHLTSSKLLAMFSPVTGLTQSTGEARTTAWGQSWGVQDASKSKSSPFPTTFLHFTMHNDWTPTPATWPNPECQSIRAHCSFHWISSIGHHGRFIYPKGKYQTRTSLIIWPFYTVKQSVWQMPQVLEVHTSFHYPKSQIITQNTPGQNPSWILYLSYRILGLV